MVRKRRRMSRTRSSRRTQKNRIHKCVKEFCNEISKSLPPPYHHLVMLDPLRTQTAIFPAATS